MRDEVRTRLVFIAALVVSCTLVAIVSAVVTVSLTHKPAAKQASTPPSPPPQQAEVMANTATSDLVPAEPRAFVAVVPDSTLFFAPVPAPSSAPAVEEAPVSDEEALAAAQQAATLRASLSSPPPSPRPPPPAPAKQPSTTKGAATQQQESIYLVLGKDALLVTGMSGSMALPYASPGPCRQLRQVANVSLDMSAAATGCLGLTCDINLRVTMPLGGSCPDIPGPFRTIYFISGVVVSLDLRIFCLCVCVWFARGQRALPHSLPHLPPSSILTLCCCRLHMPATLLRDHSQPPCLLGLCCDPGAAASGALPGSPAACAAAAAQLVWSLSPTLPSCTLARSMTALLAAHSSPQASRRRCTGSRSWRGAAPPTSPGPTHPAPLSDSLRLAQWRWWATLWEEARAAWRLCREERFSHRAGSAE